MKKKIIIKFLIVILTMNLINGSVSFAKEMPKKLEEQEQKISPQQQKEQKIKTIKEILKKYKILEEKIKQNLLDMFKNFKKEDFEEKYYSLEVFKKNNVPILLYTHKKTGAQVFLNLVLDKEKLKGENDGLFFRAPSKDDSGFMHFLEHCIATPLVNYFKKNLQISSDYINAVTTNKNLGFTSKVEVFGLNEKVEKEYIKKLSKELNNPIAFEKNDKTFEIEKKRILNEIKDEKGSNLKNNELNKLTNLRDYNPWGKILEIEKATKKDLKKYYEKFIHPSNCLLIKNISELNSKTIKNYLNLWHENYFKHYEKKEIKDAKHELKNKEKYLFNLWPKDSNIFVAPDEKNKRQEFKYKAKVIFNLEKLNLKQQVVSALNLNLDLFKKEINDFVKNLGYEKMDSPGAILVFYGNKKEVFEQKILEENSKKIMRFIDSKLKNLNDDDFLYLLCYDFKDFSQFEVENINLKNENLYSNLDSYNGFPFSDFVLSSFNNFGKAISNKEFLVNEKNEIENNIEKTKEKIKQNLNIYSKLAQTSPDFIDVFKQSNKTMEQTFKKQQNKYEVLIRVLPIKLKEKNSKKFVKDFAKQLFIKALNEELNYRKGLIYTDFYYQDGIENEFLGLFRLNKNSVKNLEDYIFKNFKKIMKNVSIKESELNKLKKQYKENFNSFKKEFEETFKNENKMVKDLERYAKTGKIDENFILQKKDLKMEDLFFFLTDEVIRKLNEQFFTFYKDFEDYNAFFEKEMCFKEKYKTIKNEKITPEFAKDFLENSLKPNLKKIKKAYKLAEEKLKALNSITIKDVNDLIKTAYLVKDKNEIEKVNKNIGKKHTRQTKIYK